MVTNASQAVVWRAQNMSFTRTIMMANGLTLNIGFPGQYYDAELGLWNNGFRDYFDGVGRYIESDPVGLGGGMSTYAYVGGNPLSFVDSLGLVAASGAMADCLAKIFGQSVAGVNVRNKLIVTNEWITTRTNSIRLPQDESVGAFFSDPHLVLHEYFHVLRQWNVGGISRSSYAAEYFRHGAADGNRYEDEANGFADKNLDSLKKCLEEAKKCEK